MDCARATKTTDRGVLRTFFNGPAGAVYSTMTQDFRIAASDQDDADLAEAIVEPILYLPTGSDSDEQLPAAWDCVTEGQIHVYAVTWVEREVNNGGFWQYFYNSSADLPTRALEGLQAMGATDYAELLERAMGAFPNGAFPKTRNDRKKLLPEDPYDDELSTDQKVMIDTLETLDSEFYDLYGDGEQLYKIIADYIRSHPEDFFR